eukprot:80530_1
MKKCYKIPFRPCQLILQRRRCHFDRDLKVRQRDWAASLSNSAQYDYLRDEVANRILAERVLAAKKEFPVVVDLGAHSGHIHKILKEKSQNGIKHLIQIESSRRLLLRDNDNVNRKASLTERLKDTLTRRSKALTTELLVSDESCLELPASSVDAVLSNLSLHWINDVPTCFNAIHKCLKPDGLFTGAILGGITLQELRSSFIMAEDERRGGNASHVSPLTSISDVGDQLQGAGFKLITVDDDIIEVPFPSMFTLCEHLRAMAETHCTHTRATEVPLDVFLAAAAAYQTVYPHDEESIKATFNIIFFTGWKPAPTQPKPMKRGSANTSFKDLNSMGTLDEEIEKLRKKAGEQ